MSKWKSKQETDKLEISFLRKWWRRKEGEVGWKLVESGRKLSKAYFKSFHDMAISRLFVTSHSQDFKILKIIETSKVSVQDSNRIPHYLQRRNLLQRTQFSSNFDSAHEFHGSRISPGWKCKHFPHTPWTFQKPFFHLSISKSIKPTREPLQLRLRVSIECSKKKRDARRRNKKEFVLKVRSWEKAEANDS